MKILNSIKKVPSKQLNLKGNTEKALQFIRNTGQTDSLAQYYCQGSGYSIHFTQSDLRLTLCHRSQLQEESSHDLINGFVLFLEFVNPNPKLSMRGLNQLNTKINFFTGNKSSAWKTNLSVFSQIEYQQIWNGIDLLFEGQKGKLKYYFNVQAGTDPQVIGFKYRGIEQLQLDDGDHALLLNTAVGLLRDDNPICFQKIQGKQVPVSANFALQKSEDGEPIIRFIIGPEYDPHFDLVIDPGLDYSTYLGGTDDDAGHSIWVDADGHAYVTGKTFSSDFPTTPGVFQPNYTIAYDVFVSKISSNGSALLWSTYLGGGGNDWANSIIADEAGNVYIAGITDSPNSDPFPVTPGAYQTVRSGVRDAFITKLSPDGDALIYSTLLGGNADDYAYAIHVDASGHSYVTGETTSLNFPITLGSPFAGISDAFITKFNLDGTALDYSRYLGGNGTDYGRGIRVDPDGYCYVTGSTSSTNFPITAGAYMETHQGDHDIFVSKLNSDGSLNWSTYLGGSDDDHTGGLCIDSSKNVYVVGNTISDDYPTTPGAFRPDPIGDQDMIVTKLNASGSALIYSTRMGGSNSDMAWALRVDSAGNAYVVGGTNSTDMPTTPDAFSRTKAPDRDAIVFKLNRTGSALIYSTYLGGHQWDEGRGIALDLNGNVYITGQTFSDNFPTTPGSLQPLFSGLDGFSDAFVLKILLSPPPSGGAFRLTRFVINTTDDFPEEAQQYDGDFFLQYDNRKVIHGVVRDPLGFPIPASVVKFFKVLSGDPETTCDLESIGHAITDDCGQFMIGPLPPGVDLVMKIFFLKNESIIGTPSPIIGTATPLDP